MTVPVNTSYDAILGTLDLGGTPISEYPNLTAEMTVDMGSGGSVRIVGDGSKVWIAGNYYSDSWPINAMTNWPSEFETTIAIRLGDATILQQDVTFRPALYIAGNRYPSETAAIFPRIFQCDSGGNLHVDVFVGRFGHAIGLEHIVDSGYGDHGHFNAISPPNDPELAFASPGEGDLSIEVDKTAGTSLCSVDNDLSRTIASEIAATDVVLELGQFRDRDRRQRGRGRRCRNLYPQRHDRHGQSRSGGELGRRDRG